MDYVFMIEYKGKKILHEDFSRVTLANELKARMAVAREVIHSQPENSVLALADVSGIVFNKDMLDAMKEFTKDNTPYIKAVAVVGVSGLLSVALQTIARVTGREFRIFDTLEAGKDWLVTQ